VPIATSDPVTYTVTAVLMARMKVDYHGQDTETVVIAVAVGDINLALGKPAGCDMKVLLIDMGVQSTGSLHHG
jgi:hypothetical protein